jgi:hypothetical protein
MSFVEKAVPSITSMIRLDHTHAMAAFHRYRRDLPSKRKAALAEHVCLALEIHAQLEEEIFYPALKRVLPDDEILQKSQPEHDEMKALIARLRTLDAENPDFESTFYTLMRTVMHHVADEEAVLLPAAETRLADQLGRLGALMTKRRVELLGPRSLEAATTGALTFPYGAAALVVGALAVGGLAYAAASGRRH